MIKYFYAVILFIASYATFMAQNFSVTLTKVERECELAQANVSVTSSASYSVNWSNGSIASSINELEPGAYTVIVTNSQNKDTTISFTVVNILCEPIPENHFTPNGDDFNDTWEIGRIEKFPDFELFVYNRWGQLVHRQENEFKSWDGKSLGLLLPDATYYYVVFLSKSDKKNFIKGAVSIIK
jgi:gliding motility-associated-like protein